MILKILTAGDRESISGTYKVCLGNREYCGMAGALRVSGIVGSTLLKQRGWS